jgi:nitrate reductase NapE component
LWYWQGLRWAPGGFLLLATAAAVTAPVAAPVRWAGWLLAAIGAARLHGLAADYYGRWTPQLRPGTRTGGGLTASSALILALVIDARFTPPILVTAVVGAAILLGYGFATGGGRPHYVGGVATLGALAPLPAVGLVDGGRQRLVIWLVACGVLYPVLAVLDHRELAMKRRDWTRRRQLSRSVR